MHIWLFAQALCKHWWALMSSAIFTLLGMYVAAERLGNDWIVRASFTLALLLFIVAAYLAWRDEHGEVVALQGRPEVSFGLLRVGGQLDGEYLFQFRNASDATAIDVSLSSINGAHIVYTFTAIPSLVKGFPTHMEYRAAIGPFPMPSGNSDMVRALALDSPGTKGACYETKLEFSNYGDVSRWQTDYWLDCDFESKSMTCRTGMCRKLR